MKERYSMLIQWSDEDKVYVVSLPEFPNCQTHGETYEEAARMGQEVLEMLVQGCTADGRPLPKPLTLQATGDPWDREQGNPVVTWQSGTAK